MLQESVQLVSQSAILSLALFPRSVGKLTNSEEEVQVAKDGNRTLQINVSPERLIASRTSKPNQGADALREQLFALQRQQMSLKARYSESHPFVVNSR